jgi:hypothetical protein
MVLTKWWPKQDGYYENGPSIQKPEITVWLFAWLKHFHQNTRPVFEWLGHFGHPTIQKSDRSTSGHF